MSKITFREEPSTLSMLEIGNMLHKNDFFDNVENINARGFINQYEEKTIKNCKVVIDNASGLMWQHSGSANSMKFNDAKIWVKHLNSQTFAEYSNWRLPTIEEAMSLIENKKSNKSLYINLVFNEKQCWIWTSDIKRGDFSVWIISFACGIFDCDPPGYFNYIRAVRSI